MASLSREDSDEKVSDSIDRVVSHFDKDLYDNDEFRRTAKPLLKTSPDSENAAGVDAGAHASAGAVAAVPDAAPSSAPLPNVMVAQGNLANQQVMVLTPQVRDAVLADLHGIAEYKFEEPSFIATCLEQMERCLNNMSGDVIDAYIISLQRDASYASDPTFRLMFLRADSFDPQAAAARLALHFTLKLELFGEELLTKNITMEDLDPDTIQLVESEYMGPLPMRDRSGRLIVVLRSVPFTRTTLIKAQFFSWFKMVEGDVTSQVRGFVCVSYNIGNNAVIDHRVFRDVGFAIRASPVRVVANHILVHGPQNGAIILGMRYYMKPASFLRFQPYLDKTVDEYHRDLKRFGLPMEAFIKAGRSEDNLVERTQMRFLAQKLYLMRCEAHAERQKLLIAASANRRAEFEEDENEQPNLELPRHLPAAEAAAAPVRYAIVPPNPMRRNGNFGSTNDDPIHGLRRNDVIFGHGQSREHHGTVQVQAKIKELLPAYQAASRSKKTELAESVIKFVHDLGGRFLRVAEDDILGMATANVGGYAEVPHAMAREQISRFFRKFGAKK